MSPTELNNKLLADINSFDATEEDIQRFRERRCDVYRQIAVEAAKKVEERLRERMEVSF